MNTQVARLPGRGRIDRDRPLTFTVDGRVMTGHPGDTVASALLANGILEVAPSLYRGRPRGIVAAGVEEPNALLRVDGACAESMLQATVVELRDGLHAETLSGLGRLDSSPDPAVYDKKYVHSDVLVVGAGPAGLSAAAAAASSGARVILLDEQPETGGMLLSGSSDFIGDEPALDWAAHRTAEIEAAPEAFLLRRTSAFGSFDSNYVLALQRRDDYDEASTRTGVSRQRVWHIRAAQIILATGAHERPLVFAGNDVPGVMLASAVRSYVNRYAVAPGRRVVVATTNDSAYDTVTDLLAAGIEVPAVIDARDETSVRAAEVAGATGIRIETGSAIVDAKGTHRLSAVVASGITSEQTLTGQLAEIDCDLLAVSGGWSPVVHLHSQRQGDLRWDDTLAAFVPDGEVPGQRVVGAADGTYRLDGCVAEGMRAGDQAAEAAGFEVDAGLSPVVPDAEPAPQRPLWLTPGVGGEPADWHNHFVDYQRDSTVADVWRAARSGMRNVEHVKRYTSISTAHDQGKTSAVNAIGVIARALGSSSPGEVGTTSFRPPYTPVSFAVLAGRERGALFEPERTTPAQPWHVARGAVFEDVGQWKRPRYYPEPGEDMAAAVARECRAARQAVAFMDASTLGKIEICGPDAGELLNRVYTNGFKKLAVGSGRYGLMCTADGMIFDDGVTLRLDENRYFMTTTTGGAANVLDWLEGWLQIEWPDLDVYCTSVTEQWSTIAVVGPRSRDVVAKLAPDLDLSAEQFPFMAFKETALASGVRARICRISFSGELAYEVNVASWHGLAVWEQVYAAGEALGITPYGTEAMHVLRAEKGYIIVGQDTDGTVTPHDAGMDWVVSRRKDFIGKRSLRRTDTARADRKHLVGLLPVDRTTRLPEGSQLVATDATISPAHLPVPMLGHVTSSYHSEALGRPFALAMLHDGRSRIGQSVLAPVGGVLVEALVTDTVLYDSEGTKRDG